MTELLRACLPAPDPALAAALRKPFRRGHAIAALAAAQARPARATSVLAGYFRSTRALGSKDRPVVSEAVYAAVKHGAFLAQAGAAGAEALIDGVAALWEGERFPALAGTGSEAGDLAVAVGVPPGLAGEWLARWGAAGAAALGAALAGRAPVHLRVNRARSTRAAAAAALAAAGVDTRPLPGLEDGLEVLGRPVLGRLPAALDGLVEVQDASSQHLVAALGPLAGLRVWDACAGAGGKALALAAAGARVWASDPRSHALDELQRRAARAGAAVRVGPPPADAAFDLVLVDAPCSGSGRLRREPALRWGLDPAAFLGRQAAILAAAAPRVRAGGLLVYATCSLAEAENHPPLPGEGAAWRLDAARVLWPHTDDTDGFGWRVWARSAG
jgi:16S rRNA (cytosine967-C5)-methyltransferase